MLISEKRLRFLKPTEPKANYPLFIFLPGMDGTGELLENQLPGLEKFFDIRCLSIPANDLSDWSNLAKQTADLIQAEQRLGENRPVYICGESFGACLALKLAAHYSELFDRLILINPASSFARQPIMGWGSTIVKWLPAPLYQVSAIAFLPFLIASKRVSLPTQNSLLAAMRSVSANSAAWRISLLNNFYLDELPSDKISQPVLVIASEADQLLPSVTEADKLLDYLPNATKVLLPESGHACLLEKEIRLEEILSSKGFLLDNYESKSLMDNCPSNLVIN